MTEPISPFSCGTEYGEWTDLNCATCTRLGSGWDDQGNSGCDIETALALSYLGDGTVTEEIARRAGLPHGVWCPERRAVTS